MEKQVSVDGGETFHDADDVSGAPKVSAPTDALYRLIARITGTVDLVNLVVSDATLGLVNVPVDNLAVGAQTVLTSGNTGFGNIFQEDRCLTPGEYPNTAKVMAESSTTGQQVSDSDAAVVICTGEPCINVEKQISVDGGVTFADADNPTDPDVPTIPAPGGAEYRFVIKNCGDVDLKNVSVDDAQLGIPPAIVGDLSVGQQIVIDKGNFQFGGLVHPARCPDPGTYTNIVQVGAQSSETDEFVEDIDPANLICTGAPAIDLEKQISVDSGATYVDADAVASAPSIFAPGGAQYRFIVRNTGAAPLTKVVINDAALNISGFVVGTLAVNAERTITSGEIGALHQPSRCPTPGTYANVADVSGIGAGRTVTDSDPANSVCDQPVCDIRVEKTCKIVTPPPPISTVSTCKDLKLVTGLTMIWDGPDGVDVRTELGQTFSDVNNGDVISFSTAGGDKDFEISLSGALSGFSTFHTSCSDEDMNGIEDCGKREGDGKKDGGGVNEWIFDGMAGEKGAFTCP